MGLASSYGFVLWAVPRFRRDTAALALAPAMEPRLIADHAPALARIPNKTAETAEAAACPSAYH